jgi:GMP reductase
MDKYAGGVANYRASEGKSVLVPYKGSLESTIQDILGGVRSTCTYVGAKRLKELTKRTTFIRVLEQENRVYGKEQ